MIRDIIQFQKFKVSEGSCFEQSRDRLNRRAGAGADNDVVSRQDAGFRVRQIDLEFNCPGDKGDVAQGNVQALSCFAFTASLQPTSSEYSKIGCGRPIR